MSWAKSKPKRINTRGRMRDLLMHAKLGGDQAQVSALLETAKGSDVLAFARRNGMVAVKLELLPFGAQLLEDAEIREAEQMEREQRANAKGGAK